MPSFRSDYAIVEWSFLSLDHRFHALEPIEKLAYLYLWTYCVAVRRDWFLPRTWSEHLAIIAYHARIPLEHVENMIRTCIDRGLITRTKGGTHVIAGVRDKHSKLRGWCGKWSASRDPGEERERRREESKATGAAPGSESLSLDKQIEALEQKANLTDGEQFSLARLRKQQAAAATENSHA